MRSSELHPFIPFIIPMSFYNGSPEKKKCKQGKYNIDSKTSLQHLNHQSYSFVFNSKGRSENITCDAGYGLDSSFHCQVFNSVIVRWLVRSNCRGVTETNPSASAPTSVPRSGTPVCASPPI